MEGLWGQFKLVFGYLVTAGIVAWLFKMAIGLISWFYTAILIMPYKFKFEAAEDFLTRHPYLAMIQGTFNHITTGCIYGFIIGMITMYTIYLGGESWLFKTFAMIWAYTIVAGAGTALLGTLFLSSVLSTGIFIFWLGPIGPVMTALGLLVIVMPWNLFVTRANLRLQ